MLQLQHQVGFSENSWDSKWLQLQSSIPYLTNTVTELCVFGVGLEAILLPMLDVHIALASISCGPCVRALDAKPQRNQLSLAKIG